MTVAWVIGQARAMSRRAALAATRNCVRQNGHRTRRRSSSAVLNVRVKHLTQMGCLQQRAAVPRAVQPGMVHWRRRLLALLANFDRRNAGRCWCAGMALSRERTRTQTSSAFIEGAGRADATSDALCCLLGLELGRQSEKTFAVASSYVHANATAYTHTLHARHTFLLQHQVLFGD